MSLSEIDIGVVIESKSPVQVQKIKDELFNIKARLKRAYDRGLSKDEAVQAQALLDACSAAEAGLDEVLQNSN